MGGQSEARSKGWGGLGVGITVVRSGVKAKNTETFNFAVVKIVAVHPIEKLWKLERFIMKTLQLYTIINYDKTGSWYGLSPSFATGQLDCYEHQQNCSRQLPNHDTMVLLYYCYDTMILLYWYNDAMMLLCYYYGNMILLCYYHDAIMLL